MAASYIYLVASRNQRICQRMCLCVGSNDEVLSTIEQHKFNFIVQKIVGIPPRRPEEKIDQKAY